MSADLALANLLERFITTFKQQVGSLPFQQFDPEWLSLCQVGECFLPTEQAQSAYIYWQPVEQHPQQSFQRLEEGLQQPIHDSVKQYYTGFWSDGFVVDSAWGKIDLIQVWNEADFERLLTNLIGHIVNQKGQQNPAHLSFFIGCVEATDQCVSILNHSGEVVLEPPGSDSRTVIAKDLSSFLNNVTPVIDSTSARNWHLAEAGSIGQKL